MTPAHRTELQLFTAVGLVVVGCGLLIAGFVIAPQGEIHHSVLVAFGEALSFAGAIFGIDYTYKVKVANRKENE
ncbi:hypothetical protein [Alistipes putredinis]|uniref:hypothetical protein n=1 Tax=Alistipes putredinis TaxID=28117 RepID=UPI003AB237CA